MAITSERKQELKNRVHYLRLAGELAQEQQEAGNPREAKILTTLGVRLAESVAGEIDAIKAGEAGSTAIDSKP